MGLIKITWLGHAAFMLEGSKKVLIDPFIDDNPLAPVKSSELEPDLIAVTHGHLDHLGDTVKIAKRCNCPVVCIYELSRYLDKFNVEAIGINIGGSVVVKDVKFTMVKAIHSADLVRNGEIVSLGSPVGFIVTLDGVKIYHTGDTDVFYDMKLIGELHSPDIMLLPIGDRYTMGIDGAIKAIELVSPKYAIPMHYNTFPVIQQDPQKLLEKVKALNLKTEVVILKPGETFKYEAKD